MTTNTSDIQSELKDACQRVAVDSTTRAKLIDVVVTEYIEHKKEHDSAGAVRSALNSPGAQEILSQLDITEFTVDSDREISISFSRNFNGDFNPDIILNGQMCILGRVGSEIAELALDGHRVALLNAEEIIKSGDKNTTIDDYHEKRKLGSQSGPYYPKQPDGIVKRSIRGMLPYKTSRGRDAFQRIRVYIGIPDKFSGEAKVPENKRVALNPQKNKDYVTIGEVSSSIGAKVRW